MRSATGVFFLSCSFRLLMAVVRHLLARIIAIISYWCNSIIPSYYFIFSGEWRVEIIWMVNWNIDGSICLSDVFLEYVMSRGCLDGHIGSFWFSRNF